MKYLSILLFPLFLIACAKNPSTYDYLLKEKDVICEPISIEEVTVNGRYSTTYMETTYKCYFSHKSREDLNDYQQRQNLKKLFADPVKEIN